MHVFRHSIRAYSVLYLENNFVADTSQDIMYSGTCVLWTPWDQPKVSRLSRCPDFPGQFT